MADKIQGLSNLSGEMLALLAKVPVVTPPQGIQSNFVNPPTRTALQTWVTSIFLAIAMIFYVNRVYVKTRLMKTWSWDDVTLAITVLLTVGQYIATTRGATKFLMGRHLWDISVAQMLTTKLPPIAYSIIVLTPWTLLFLKITFFLLYIHLFYRIRWIRICSWLGICYVVLTMGAVGIYAFIVANPHESVSWAVSAVRLGVPVGVMGLVADIAIFIIPIAAIIPLQISRAKRFGALLIFLTGGSAIISAILNIYYRYRLVKSDDTLWDAVPGWICSLCELLLGITCACLPSAAYGFRHEGSVYHRVLHPSHYSASRKYSSKQYHSSISKPSLHKRPGTADGGSLLSRTRIRCTTYLEISNAGRESNTEINTIEGGRERQPADRDVELAALEPAYLRSPATLQRTVSITH